ncbi:MAG: HigA family addiction module antitoxin [Ignavibacteria bacterium]|nr:HigA family addiction module antitoxin [Ignavibacteria bacterium]
MTTKEKNIYSDLPIPPGEFLEEVIDDLGMGKDELAKRMNRPAAKLSAIYSGEKAITPDTALQLEKVTGVPAHIWTGLESEYRLTLARLQEKREEEKNKKEIPLVTKFDYNELVKYGYVERKTRALDRVKVLQSFHAVTSLCNVENLKRYQTLFRQKVSAKNKVLPEALASWLRIGEIEAQKFNTKPFDEDGLYNLIPELRAMTLQSPPKFQKKMETNFADVGVALVIVPHLPKTCAHGASFWINKEKAILMTTIRGKWADIFWFSLFHELGHILLHSKQEVFIESDTVDYVAKDLEVEADKFATDNLIPRKEYERFVSEESFTKSDIRTFANKIQIHSGIVVGRLQHDGKIPYSQQNDLREKYSWGK